MGPREHGRQAHKPFYVRRLSVLEPFVDSRWMDAEFSSTDNQRLSLAYTRQQAGVVLSPYQTMDSDRDNAGRAIVKYSVNDLSQALRNLRVETYFIQVKHFMSDRLRTTATDATWSMAADAASRAIGGRVEADLGRDFTFGVESYYRNWDVPAYMWMGGCSMRIIPCPMATPGHSAPFSTTTILSPTNCS